MKNRNQSHQIFIKSPNQSHIQTLTLTPTLTLTDLIPPNTTPPPIFTINGKPINPISPSTPLCSLMKPFSTIYINFKLLGGGGDGGATGAESRDCYLNMYAVKKPDKVDPNEKRLSKWMNCALSFEPLMPPCVIDGLGNVFNKEAIVRALIEKRVPRELGHVRGLRDMIGIELSEVKVTESEGGGNGIVRFQCPITGLEFNGKYKFVALRKCGHVLSVKALKEVKSSSCLVCHVEYDEGDKIVINGDEEEVAVLRARMEEERAKAKVKVKKAKKVKNGEVRVEGEKEDGGDVDRSRLSGTKHGIDWKEAEKLLAGKVEVNTKLGVVTKGTNEAPAKRFKAVDVAPPSANKEVYASIFTSSKKSNLKETYMCRSLPLGRN